ncbi:hypothetical protein [Emticicia fluvialis]|uniref:hypothetical protein n=1 Tax=Emticicia fluvialis TaxID=2974474 RepID=UPI002165B33A|nr:hypothetical protein [Emticicia fluvialis]
MKQFILILLANMFFLNLSLAQDSLQKKHLIVKFAPLAMFDVDNTFQMAAEHNLSGKRWTLSEEFGYGTGKANLWGNSFNSSKSDFRENFRAKIEARKYKEAFTGRYAAYELFYKQINDRYSKNVARECENGACNYYETVSYPVNKFVVGLTAKIGYQLRIRDEFKKNTKFVFDFYVGAGIRRIIINHHDNSGPGEDYWNYGRKSLFDNSGLGYKDARFNIPHLALGFKLGYIIF